MLNSGSIAMLDSAINPGVTKKACTICGVVKTLDMYYGDSRSPDGKKSACKDCHQGQGAIYVWRNRGAVNARKRKWRERTRSVDLPPIEFVTGYKRCKNCDGLKTTDQFYTDTKTRDRLRAECTECNKGLTAWYQKEKPHLLNARTNAYKKRNPGKTRAQQHKRRAQLAKAEGEYTAEDVEQIKQDQRNR